MKEEASQKKVGSEHKSPASAVFDEDDNHCDLY
jgi:hypothetical protein